MAGPHDFHASAFSKTGAPSLDLSQFGTLEDGTYTYQLTAATDEKLKTKTKLDDGRGVPTEARKGVAASGTFHVRNGAIVKRDVTARPNRRDEQGGLFK